MTSLTHPPPSLAGWVKLVEASQQDGLALQGKHRRSGSRATIPAIQMLLWRFNNQAALRENDNLPFASSAVSTTSAKNNCITKCLWGLSSNDDLVASRSTSQHPHQSLNLDAVDRHRRFHRSALANAEPDPTRHGLRQKRLSRA